MAEVFDFRPGRSIRGINPQEAGEFLEQLRKEKGRLIPEDVLEAAKPEDSPLHDAFEWDNDAAAHQHRLVQARRLVTSLRILNGNTAKPTTAYLSVKTPDQGRTYMPTVQVLSDDELKLRAMTELKTFIESLERKYRHLGEVADLLARMRQNVG